MLSLALRPAQYLPLPPTNPALLPLLPELWGSGELGGVQSVALK